VFSNQAVHDVAFLRWFGAAGVAAGVAAGAGFDGAGGGAAVVVGAPLAEPAGIAERSAVSFGGVVSAQARPAVRNSSAPTAGSHIGVFGSGGAATACAP